MVLDGKCWFAFHTNPFYGLVIQINMGYFNMIRFFYCLRIYTKAMILRCDLAKSGFKVFYRVIQSPVPVVHFKSRDIIGKSK